MAKEYRLGFVRKMINRMVAGRIRKGKMADNAYLLTTLGRKSGMERTTPITLARSGDNRYVVSPYGNVGWVHNVRAAGQAELSRGDQTEAITLTEVDAQEAGPILKKYVTEVSVVRSFFDADKDAPIEEFINEAAAHPVFRVS